LLAALVLAWSLAAAQEAALLGPQPGVLLLKTGQVMRGDITPAGDHFVVAINAGGEVKIAADKVEAQCADIEAAYDWKLRRLSGEGAGPHLDLAEWCLRHNLYRQCAQQLSLALATEPHHPRLAGIDRRLQLALAAPETPTKSSTPISAIVSNEELDKMLRELPKGSLERFTTIVQPLLNNRCGAAHCHGATTTSDFRLLRPPTGFNAPQRFTQRNLYAALQFVDRHDPLSSKLLTMSQEAHGGGKEASLDGRNKSQLADLQKWVEQLAPAQNSATPATIAVQPTPLSTPLRSGSTADAVTPSLPAQPPIAPQTAGPPPAPPQPDRASSLPKDSVPWRPRDPFDPEIFNRRQTKAR
jgi:hypothetical protein